MIELMIHASLLSQDKVQVFEKIERKEKGTVHDKRENKVSCPLSWSLSVHHSYTHPVFNFPLPLGIFSDLTQGGPSAWLYYSIFEFL